MCGIVAVIGSREASPLLLEGLRQLEYRGYDSAGLVLNQDEAAFQVRTLGKVSNLEDAMIEQRHRADSGLAQTRWATPGIPSETNAHPHGSNGKIYIVHNGIIENHDEVVVVCKMGQSAGPATKTLRSQGFNRAQKLSGGMMEWDAQKLPVVTQ